MADDTKGRAPEDRSRVELNDERNLRHWCEEFACTPDELRAAVKAVGVMVPDLRVHFSKGREAF